MRDWNEQHLPCKGGFIWRCSEGKLSGLQLHFTDVVEGFWSHLSDPF